MIKKQPAKLKWSSLEKVFGKSKNNPEFKRAYRAEMRRLKRRGSTIRQQKDSSYGVFSASHRNSESRRTTKTKRENQAFKLVVKVLGTPKQTHPDFDALCPECVAHRLAEAIESFRQLLYESEVWDLPDRKRKK